MRSRVVGNLVIALTAALPTCCGCTTLLTSSVAPPVGKPFVDADDPTVEGREVVKKAAADAADEASDQRDRRLGPWTDLTGELNRFFTFGDPKEMNSSQFDSFSDRQMRAMRAEIDGGAPVR